MRGHALAAGEDLHLALGDAQVDRRADEQVAHRVVVAGVRDVAVGLDLAAVDPLAHLEGLDR